MIGTKTRGEEMAKKKVPRINSTRSKTLEENIKKSTEMIIKWITETALEIYNDSSVLDEDELSKTDWKQEFSTIIEKNPKLIGLLRALCVRHIGRSQLGDFTGISSGRVKKLEEGKKPKFTEKEQQAVAEVLKDSLHPEWAAWILEQRDPTVEETNHALDVIRLRSFDRNLATQLRYKHEKRQTDKLAEYLTSNGYEEVSAESVTSPRKMTPGTFVRGCSVQGQKKDGEDQVVQIDVLVKAKGSTTDKLPIFMEAKSVADRANGHKRMEEALAKHQKLKKKQPKNKSEPFVYMVLAGGTFTKTNLQTLQSEGIDWVFEDDLEVLDTLLDWYRSSE